PGGRHHHRRAPAPRPAPRPLPSPRPLRVRASRRATQAGVAHQDLPTRGIPMINLSTTLAELVTRNERYAPVLERAGLDYCCGGQRTLREAALDAGLDPSQVLGDLLRAVEPAAPPPEWTGLAPAELCRHIVDTHHRFLRERLPELIALAEKVEGVHGGRHPELHEVRGALQVMWS